MKDRFCWLFCVINITDVMVDGWRAGGRNDKSPDSVGWHGERTRHRNGYSTERRRPSDVKKAAYVRLFILKNYFFGFPASERFFRTVPSSLRSRGCVPPPGFGTTTVGFRGLLSAIFLPHRCSGLYTHTISMVLSVFFKLELKTKIAFLTWKKLGNIFFLRKR